MILEQVNQLIPEVMKAEGKSLDALKLIKSELVRGKYKAKGEWTEEDEVSVLLLMAAKCEESILDYKQHGREDLAEKEMADLEVIRSLTPKQPTPEEIQEFVEAVLDEYVKAKGDGYQISKKDIRPVIDIVKQKFPHAENKYVVDAINKRS